MASRSFDDRDRGRKVPGIKSRGMDGQNDDTLDAYVDLRGGCNSVRHRNKSVVGEYGSVLLPAHTDALGLYRQRISTITALNISKYAHLVEYISSLTRLSSTLNPVHEDLTTLPNEIDRDRDMRIREIEVKSEIARVEGILECERAEIARITDKIADLNNNRPKNPYSYDPAELVTLATTLSTLTTQLDSLDQTSRENIPYWQGREWAEGIVRGGKEGTEWSREECQGYIEEIVERILAYGDGCGGEQEMTLGGITNLESENNVHHPDSILLGKYNNSEATATGINSTTLNDHPTPSLPWVLSSLIT